MIPTFPQICLGQWDFVIPIEWGPNQLRNIHSSRQYTNDEIELSFVLSFSYTYIHKNTIFILIYCLLSKNRKENVVIHRYNTGNGKTLWLWMNKRWLTIIIYAVACNFFLFMYKFAYVRTNSVYKWIINEDLNQPSQGW